MTVCRWHGGHRQVGIASPNFKHGRDSRYGPYLHKALAAAFTPDDPQLLELREDLAVFDASTKLMMQRRQKGDFAAPPWKEAQVAWQAFKAARDKRNAKGMVAAAEKVEAILAAGATVERDEQVLADRAEQRARIVAIESRRLKDQHEMVSRNDFGRFAAAFLQAIAVHLPDLVLRAKIQEDAERILAHSLVALPGAEVFNG